MNSSPSVLSQSSDPGWYPYELDRHAQDLVLKHRDKNDVLNESHKMRMAVAYGLERFWGEHLRLRRQERDQDKARFWAETWKKLVAIMEKAGVTIPDDPISENEKSEDFSKAVREMSNKLWNHLSPEDRRIALAVLTQLCDCIVWWTQRYKSKGE